jgi:hypothetical protein
LAQSHVTSRDYVDQLAVTFKKVDLLVPAFMPLGFLRMLADAIDSAPQSRKLEAMRALLSVAYSPERLASMFLERYSKIVHVRDFAGPIDESLKAHFGRLRHGSVTLLIPVVEGIVRKMASRQNRDVGLGTQKLVFELDLVVDREANSLHRYDERLAMLEGLRDFIRDKFLARTVDYAGLDELNRHGILHGLFESYGEENNFYRLVAILDLLCFSIGLIEGGVSCFVPESTPESNRLVLHYAQLRSLADAWSVSPSDPGVAFPLS